MKHYTQQAPRKERALTQEEQKYLAISAVSNIILMQLRYFDIFTPYEDWNKKDIYYLTLKEFNVAVSLAYSAYCKEGEELLSKMSLRTKINNTES